MPKHTRVNLSLDEATLADLATYCEQNNLNRSQAVEILVALGLQKRDEGIGRYVVAHLERVTQEQSIRMATALRQTQLASYRAEALIQFLLLERMNALSETMTWPKVRQQMTTAEEAGHELLTLFGQSATRRAWQQYERQKLVHQRPLEPDADESGEADDESPLEMG